MNIQGVVVSWSLINCNTNTHRGHWLEGLGKGYVLWYWKCRWLHEITNSFCFVLGFYCPEGTAEPIQCPAGTFSNALGLHNVTECTLCLAGYYCESLNLTDVEGKEILHKYSDFWMNWLLNLYTVEVNISNCSAFLWVSVNIIDTSEFLKCL